MIKNQNISKTNIIFQGSRNIVSDMDGEKVMLSISNGKYYNLGDVGGDIWELIKDPVSVKQLVSTLTAQYDVDPSECEQEVLSFLGLLAEEGLIEVKEA
ncbi:lasso peptide biosynthesis PqqD family chaperone [Alkalihalobacterium alkalinitrilicum]|uniref:lasso peptide biosynthesis PqqD family chaperone n=1 Tax=Alkalihalobacterium alkalinitrilicum TaxID=427920 RepID=UPI000994D68B|nr:lasso peptide biosynthesis PqqD family chaperone [Alkalihalobacterium alkalinitrilicum]